MAKVNQSKHVVASKGGARGIVKGPSKKHIDRGRAPMAANPQAQVDSIPRSAGFKGPYHG